MKAAEAAQSSHERKNEQPHKAKDSDYDLSNQQWIQQAPLIQERHIHFVLLRSRVADILAKLNELSLHRA